MMTPNWQKKYHALYLQCKSEFDPHVIEWISNKEDIICFIPQNYPFLKHDLSGIRRYKSGKLRILYATSTESVAFWQDFPPKPEVLFLYVDLRSDETYIEALKALKKHKIL